MWSRSYRRALRASNNWHPHRTKPLMTSCLELCSPDDVPEGTALRVEAGTLTLAVFNVAGEFYVTDDNCTHGPGSLSEGYIEGDVVECNFHNGQFNIRTGEVVSPPCMVPIKTYPARVENGKVVIEVD
jgi:nitrite reductase/ring-hydroxylating ferredoxin subunit